MASGGTWQTQNKVRPGAYINVVGVPKALSKVGERGVVAVAMPLKWGGLVTEITANELITGAGFLTLGVQYTDGNYTPSVSPSTVECAPGFDLRLILQYAQKAIVFRTNYTNAVQAALAIVADTPQDDIFSSVKAKYPGTFGNRIKFTIEYAQSQYVLKTYIDDVISGTTKAATLAELTGDSLITIVYKDAAVYDAALATPMALTNGSDGSTLDTGWLAAALKEFNTRAWNVFVTETDETNDKSAIKAAIDDLRDNNGVKVQAVIYNGTVDAEGIINIASGVSYVLSDGTIVRPTQTVFAIAGMTAGASITESNTGAVVEDAIDLNGNSYPMTNDEIIAALNAGKIVLSRRGDGAIVVEKDINSFHTFTPTKGYVFSKNRPLRVLDGACNDIKLLFNKSYLGKVSNNDEGRTVFKADIISYMDNLQKIGAIQNFDAQADIDVQPGDDIDSLVVALWIQPVDSMEKLYMTINVRG